ncbi:nickel-dependent lactate racemase [Acidobacteria bacterium AB60]|nr:nickel-dependent lactate racemase [Acidobacteria bacterium AB60]
MRTRFAFGKTGFEVAIPDNYDCAVLESRAVQPLADANAALEQALDHPLASAPLEELAKGKRRVAVVVCDITRPAPNRITLPPLLERLHRSGIIRADVTILIATGLHRAATREEVDQIVGPEIARSYRIISNDARATGQHRHLGATGRGTPIHIHNDFVDADLRITLGFIEPHLMAGYSGGRKLVVPGVAAEPTIKAIHSPRFMREPLATEGSIEGNPLHQELLEIARAAHHDFILDVTLTRDRQISGVFAGDPILAHAAGVRFVQEHCLNHLEHPADLVVTSSAGFPLDLTFYQSVKAVTAAQHLIRESGSILVVAECSEGVGSLEFAASLKTLQSFEAYLHEIATSPVEIDQWQVEKLALAALQSQLFFYTPGVQAEDLGILRNRWFPTLKDALKAATAELAPGAKVLLVPEGPYTFAKVLRPATETR